MYEGMINEARENRRKPDLQSPEFLFCVRFSEYLKQPETQPNEILGKITQLEAMLGIPKITAIAAFDAVGLPYDPFRY